MPPRSQGPRRRLFEDIAAGGASARIEPFQALATQFAGVSLPAHRLRRRHAPTRGGASRGLRPSRGARHFRALIEIFQGLATPIAGARPPAHRLRRRRAPARGAASRGLRPSRRARHFRARSRLFKGLQRHLRARDLPRIGCGGAVRRRGERQAEESVRSARRAISGRESGLFKDLQCGLRASRREAERSCEQRLAWAADPERGTISRRLGHEAHGNFDRAHSRLRRADTRRHAADRRAAAWMADDGPPTPGLRAAARDRAIPGGGGRYGRDCAHFNRSRFDQRACRNIYRTNGRWRQGKFGSCRSSNFGFRPVAALQDRSCERAVGAGKRSSAVGLGRAA